MKKITLIFIALFLLSGCEITSIKPTDNNKNINKEEGENSSY